MVGDDERAAGRRDVLQAAGLDPEPVLVERTERRGDDGRGQLRVEAELVDLVVARHAPAQERQRARDLAVEVAPARRDGLGDRGRGPGHAGAPEAPEPPALRPGRRAAHRRTAGAASRAPSPLSGITAGVRHRGPPGRRRRAADASAAGRRGGTRSAPRRPVGPRPGPRCSRVSGPRPREARKSSNAAGRGVPRGVAERLLQPADVDPATVGEVLDEVLGQVDHARPAQHGTDALRGRAGHGQRRATRPAGGLGEQQHALAGDVVDAAVITHRGAAQHLEAVVLVDELQARVVAQDRRDDRHREQADERRVDPRADEVGEPEHGDVDVRPAAAEPADVRLDLDRVLGEPGARRRLRLRPLGEQGRVAGRGAVHRRRRLHDEPAQAGRLLARGEQLHRADDVELFHGRPAARARGGGRDAHVDDRVDLRRRDHLGDDRVADVGADELRAAEVGARRDDVDADHSVDAGLVVEQPDEVAAQVSGDPRHEHHTAHRAPPPGWVLLLVAALHARPLEQLAVLLLRHALAPLLDDRAHGVPRSTDWRRSRSSRRAMAPGYPSPGGLPTGAVAGWRAGPALADRTRRARSAGPRGDPALR